MAKKIVIKKDSKAFKLEEIQKRKEKGKLSLEDIDSKLDIIIEILRKNAN